MTLPDVIEPPADPVIHPLHPGLRPLVRADGSVQLGEDPVHGVVLTGLTRDETGPVTHLLRILTSAAVPLRVHTLSRACGVPERRVLEIAENLRHAGLMLSNTSALHVSGLAAWSLSRWRLGPEQELGARSTSTLWERRSGARVTIDGRGPLAMEIGRLLTGAHVGTVHSGWYAGLAGDLDHTSPDPSLIITVGTRLPRSRAAAWQARGITHLPLVARPASVDIGPLIIPGTGPCVTCVAIQEAPSVLADLVPDDPITDGQSDPVHVEPALASLAAGATAMLALGHIDAYPPPLGVRWHCALPLPSLAISRWVRHHECDAREHRIPLAPQDEGATLRIQPQGEDRSAMRQ